ncbi:MAG: hypothetical protein KAX57_01280 [Rhodoferax sp.]|jgi:hypothetical protein|uniref:hypothetical protein n=1 Tax=Rhodoferax sp. TaxID=50421 RepID=UPI001B734F9C|nr:hypothetical protein [Rhodoferax sp.]MBP8285450.1 hypothetical protein [Rhodoferax sp.]MBP9734292.1 hypothetical protein [Rhodoferax sp.]
MQIIRTAADVGALGPELRQLISDTFARVADCPEILGYILIVELGDTLANLDAQLGFPILANRHESVLEHTHWYELVYVLGQDGFGIEVFVPKGIDLPELLAMCRLYAVPAILP